MPVQCGTSLFHRLFDIGRIVPAPMRTFTLSDFDFALPDELIAQHPAPVRSASRLLDGTQAGAVNRVFRDLAGLLPLGGSFRAAYDGPPPDADLLRMFDLEWRLDEIGQYAAWFAGPHADSPDDRTALGGLRSELSRPDRPTT